MPDSWALSSVPVMVSSTTLELVLVETLNGATRGFSGFQQLCRSMFSTRSYCKRLVHRATRTTISLEHQPAPPYDEEEARSRNSLLSCYLCLFVLGCFNSFWFLRGFPSQLDAAAACPQLHFGSNCFSHRHAAGGPGRGGL